MSEILNYAEKLEAINAARDSFTELAERHLSYADRNIVDAYHSGDRNAFNAAVWYALDELALDMFRRGVEHDGCTDEQFKEFYKVLIDNDGWRKSLYDEISNMLFLIHKEIEKARNYAHENGLA